MRKDVAEYIRYYNLERLHTANGDKTPVDYEYELKKVSDFVNQYIFTRYLTKRAAYALLQ